MMPARLLIALALIGYPRPPVPRVRLIPSDWTEADTVAMLARIRRELAMYGNTLVPAALMEDGENVAISTAQAEAWRRIGWNTGRK